MVLPRIIPVLLLKGTGIVKGKKFKDHQYIGDPLNAIHIFNKKQADEIMILDINASTENRCISSSFVSKVAFECMMPLTVGGGISSLKQVAELLSLGAEKVSLNSHWLKNPQLISDIAKRFGSQSVVVSIDVKKNLWGRYKTFIRNGSQKTAYDPMQLAKMAEDLGAGEIMLGSVEQDGLMTGYDYSIINDMAQQIKIPLIVSGGAGCLGDLKKGIQVGASACAAGSMFVYHGVRRAVLISYPEQTQLNEIYQMSEA